jgi:hypothetical protein
MANVLYGISLEFAHFENFLSCFDGFGLSYFGYFGSDFANFDFVLYPDQGQRHFAEGHSPRCKSQIRLAIKRHVMIPFKDFDILINRNSPFVQKVDEGAYRFTEKGTIKNKDGEYRSPIDCFEPHEISRFDDEVIPTEHIPLNIHLKCGSQVRELAVADCVVMPQVPSTLYRCDSKPQEVWCTRIKMGFLKEFIKEAEQQLRGCAFTVENSDDWEEMGGKMWGFATICTHPRSPDSLKVFEVSDGRLQEILPMDLARKALSLGKSAVGVGRVIIRGARRLTEGDAEGLDIRTIHRHAFPDPLYVEVQLTSFIVGGWSEEGKLVTAMLENPLVDLPPGFGYQEEADTGQNALYNDGGSSEGSDESETTAANVRTLT